MSYVIITQPVLSYPQIQSAFGQFIRQNASGTYIHLHSNGFWHRNSHSTNVNSDQLRHITSTTCSQNGKLCTWQSTRCANNAHTAATACLVVLPYGVLLHLCVLCMSLWRINTIYDIYKRLLLSPIHVSSPPLALSLPLVLPSLQCHAADS